MFDTFWLVINFLIAVKQFLVINNDCKRFCNGPSPIYSAHFPGFPDRVPGDFPLPSAGCKTQLAEHHRWMIVLHKNAF